MSDERMGLAGTLALLAATIAVVFGVALATDDAATVVDDAAATGPELNSAELLKLGIERSPTVARRVERIRGLDFNRVPEPQVTDTDELRALADEELSKPKTQAKIAAGDAQLKLLGLLEPEESFADVAAEVSADALAYYDPKEKELFLLGDAVPAGAALSEFILAHELDHALEDQVYGLPRSRPSSDDRILAESALVEGSATALMVEYAGRYLELGELFDETGTIETGAEDIPDVIRAQVTFSYFGGQRFVDELRATAEGGWDLVDFAYQERLPVSTEQILHPEKYLEDEAPLPVPEVRDPGTGWKRDDGGTVGEFFTREMLRQDAEEVGADAAAAGWGGDRYAFFRRRGAPQECGSMCRADNALAIIWRGDDAGEASDLKAAVEGFVERSLEGSPSGAGTWELEGGWAAVGGTGDLVTLALAPSEPLANRLSRPAE